MFYYIDLQAGTKETGKYFPQVSPHVHQDRDHRLHFNRFPDFIPNLSFELKKGAKLTDVLSQGTMNSAKGLLLCKRLKDLLLGFDLMNNEFYPATIRTPKGELTYYWLHLVDSGLMYNIDYKNSTFYYTRSGFKKDIIQIASYEDYLQKKEENGILWGAKATDIKLLDSFNRLLDMFVLIPFDYNIIISERLASAIKESKVTGIDIIEAPYLQ